MEIKTGDMVSALVMMASQALWAPWLREVEADDTDNARLARFLSKRRGFRQVKRAVARLRTRTLHHDSVAFVAAALQQSGVPVPGDERFDGLTVTRISLALSRYLESVRGWRRIHEPYRLQPGDVVFTQDAPCCPGLPDHVYVFMGWNDRERLIADVVDSQGFVHPRPLHAEPGGSHHDHEQASRAAFEYALRAPR